MCPNGWFEEGRAEGKYLRAVAAGAFRKEQDRSVSLQVRLDLMCSDGSLRGTLAIDEDRSSTCG